MNSEHQNYSEEKLGSMAYVKYTVWRPRATSAAWPLECAHLHTSAHLTLATLARLSIRGHTMLGIIGKLSADTIYYRPLQVVAHLMRRNDISKKKHFLRCTVDNDLVCNCGSLWTVHENTKKKLVHMTSINVADAVVEYLFSFPTTSLS